MNTRHYLMGCEAQEPRGPQSPGTWKFICHQLNGDDQVVVSDTETGMTGQQLHLLSIIRGLEYLEEPSRVSLITSSRYVGRGIRHSLQVWRENDWQWEHYGIMKPIKHRSLWQRIDRALQCHDCECRVWTFSDSKLPTWKSPPKPRAVIRTNPHKTSQEQVATWAANLAQRVADNGLSPIVQQSF